MKKEKGKGWASLLIGKPCPVFFDGLLAVLSQFFLLPRSFFLFYDLGVTAVTIEKQGDALVITHLPVEQMALLALGLALTEQERSVLRALLEGKRVYLADGALEYKKYARTAERGVYVKFTAMERELRELGIRRAANGRPYRGEALT